MPRFSASFTFRMDRHPAIANAWPNFSSAVHEFKIIYNWLHTRRNVADLLTSCLVLLISVSGFSGWRYALNVATDNSRKVCVACVRRTTIRSAVGFPAAITSRPLIGHNLMTSRVAELSVNLITLYREVVGRRRRSSRKQMWHEWSNWGSP
jgi:hypothetical protein